MIALPLLGRSALRRAVLGAALTVLVLLGAGCAVDSIEPAAGTDCRVGDVELLTAQTVPGASYVPCLADGFEEWTVSSTYYGSAGTRIRLVTERLDGTWTVEFGRTCETGDLPEAQPVRDFRGTLFRRIDDSGARYEETSYYEFDGGCVISDVDLPNNRVLGVLLEERDEGLHLVPRDSLDAEVLERTDGRVGLDPSPDGDDAGAS